MPTVNRKPQVVTELQPLATGKTAAGWNVKARSVNMSLPFFNQDFADIESAVIPGLDVGASYEITVSRLDNTGGVLASVTSTVAIAQLPSDPLYDAPKSFTLTVG
jgi:hypothetical protein